MRSGSEGGGPLYADISRQRTLVADTAARRPMDEAYLEATMALRDPKELGVS